MKKKVTIFLLMLLAIATLTGCNSRKIKEENKRAKEREENKKEENKKEENKKVSDSEKFKEEYESLNGKENGNGHTIRSIEISKNNPFIYKTDKEIVKLIEDKETFLVYFGFPTCPWCRSVLPTLVDVAKDYNVDKIYYVNIKGSKDDKDIRDTLEVDEKGKVVTKTKGTDAYYKLLDKLDKVLSDYKLTDEDEKEVDTDEKRIYAPNIIAIVDGKAKKLTTGISEKQTDSYMKLTDKMKEDSYKSFEKVIKVYVNANASCDVKGNKC